MILVLCPDVKAPSGGVRKLYRLVDVLNASGRRAALLHHVEGFRCTWFENDTPVLYPADLSTALQSLPLFVVPEIYGANVATYVSSKMRVVVFNQNAYYTFRKYPPGTPSAEMPYRQANTIGVMAVSDDNKAYLQYAFPGLRVERIRYGFDGRLFHPRDRKKAQIAYMPRKNAGDAAQVISILRQRQVLDGFEVVAIDNRTEAEVAAILRESLVFLSFSEREGFPMPPAEAMASGCAVVGYDGMGGREYLTPELAWPVAQGDIVGYARSVEEVLALARRDPDALAEKAGRGAQYIAQHHSPEQEADSLLRAWAAFESC